MQDYHPQHLSTGVEYRELQIQLNAHGSYVGLCTFLDEMHKLQRLNRVSQINIRPLSKNSKSKFQEESLVPLYDASLHLHIYFMPVKKSEQIALKKELENG
ncbi:MAG: hypothetical protein R3C11_22970 [Planctomycetaceae bacterium]